MKFTNKIVPIGMLAIILMSICGYPSAILDKWDTGTTALATATQETTVTEITSSEAVVAPKKSFFSAVESVEAIFLKLTSLVETVATYVTFQDQYVIANSYIENLMGKTVFVDGGTTIVKTDTGHLLFASENYTDTTQYEANLIELNDYLDERDIPLLYVQAPYKLSKYENLLPSVVTDGNNDNADSLLAGIDGYVDYIDLREVMYESDIDHYASFFKTDHHWLPETAFWAAGYLAEILNEEYDFDMDMSFYDIDNYNVEVYEDWFLGSQGKRVGTSIVGVDDISLITPNFETNLIYEVVSEDVYRAGTFEEALFDYSWLYPMDYYNSAPYCVYLGENIDLVNITNNLNEDGKKILLIKDSFAKPMASFLALGCSQLDLIDLRYYKDQSLMDYLSEHEGEYDLVMFLYNPGTISNGAMVFDEVVS